MLSPVNDFGQESTLRLKEEHPYTKNRRIEILWDHDFQDIIIWIDARIGQAFQEISGFKILVNWLSQG